MQVMNAFSDQVDDAIIGKISAAVTPARRVPLYMQLSAALEAEIAEGTLRAGQVLPREPDLARQLGLSRQTVSQALNALAQRGLLVRRRGIGTFVSEHPVEQPLERLYSFVRALAIDGQPLSARVLGVRLVSEPEIAQLFGLPPFTLLFELSRLFSIESSPFAHERIYLCTEIGEQLPSDGLASSVIYELLAERFGIVVTHGDETLRITSLTRSDASLLGLQSGEPAFLVERQAFAGDQIVEVRRTYVRGDRSRFRVRLAGPYLTPLLDGTTNQ